MRARVGPVRKFFLSENCSSTHFVPKSLWNFFWDHYYRSYEHYIIADCSIVPPLVPCQQVMYSVCLCICLCYGFNFEYQNNLRLPETTETLSVSRLLNILIVFLITINDELAHYV